MRKVKGQILVFEQVLIFTIGVAILMMSITLFLMYQNYYSSSTDQDQLTELKEYMLSNIIKICEKREMNSSMVISIPKRIGNNLYRISLSNQGLNITSEQNRELNDFSTLYGLNQSYNFGGMALSDLGEIVLYKNGNTIILDIK